MAEVVQNLFVPNIVNMFCSYQTDENELQGLEKMAKDLRDSEAKLLEILNQINASESNENENQVTLIVYVFCGKTNMNEVDTLIGHDFNIDVNFVF